MFSLPARRASHCLLALLLVPWIAVAAATPVKLGFNYPRTGPYFGEGLDQLRAAQLAVEEVNAQGGILGRPVELAIRDSHSDVKVARANALELIDKEGAVMLFGGASSNVAVAMGEVAEERGVPFFGTLTYANATTGADGHRHTFRECNNAWMAAKALSKHLDRHFRGGKYFYVTADYNWGWSTEESLRRFTGTTDASVHKGVRTPFPVSTAEDFKRALRAAQAEKPDVLVLVLFGQDLVNAINIASAWGLKKSMQLVVPNLTLPMAEGSGPENMAGVVGTLPWSWEVAEKYQFAGGLRFVEAYAKRHGRYPSTAGASAYTIVHEFKAAVERAGSFQGDAVVKALEGHRYTRLKDAQEWRALDHQSVQTVYVVRGNPPDVVRSDKYRLRYFEVVDQMSGAEAVQTRKEWEAERRAAKKPLTLERLAAGAREARR
ncbi:substrate-binding protein [Pyxidicoccus fallax]|uniref:ABC transporter substrate-binding protein n=1 Tax=Pyxidicoccus fallax TaxID=394095 RepID=A0A848L5J6_9BACT|nr:substrate-binding protein [Pyxidicoccus fallax]NMO13964.1 ABC transporter substrate-binding protein [Pyxidicoccus fallax]NPC76704.1 substrate-binding protein [Pyxidicoccus fallax]